MRIKEFLKKRWRNVAIAVLLINLALGTAMPALAEVVRVQPVPALDNLADVNAPAPSDDDVLQWDDGASEWVNSAFTDNQIRDADGDTKIQVEESADEDKIRFDTGGAERMIIDDTGNVGIGTATPNAPLEVKGAKPGPVGGFQSGMLHVTGAGTAEFYNAVITGHNAYNTNTQLWYLGSLSSSNNNIGLLNRQNAGIYFYTNDAFKMIIDAAGDVGIGTPTPSELLDVDGNIAVSGTVDGVDVSAHISRHEKDGADEIDLDELMGKPWEVFALEGRSMNEWWKSSDGWTLYSSGGSESETFALMRWEAQTGTTANSVIGRYTGACRSAPQNNGQRGFCTIWVNPAVTNFEFRFYITHEDEAFTPLVDTEEHGGFKIIDGDIFISAGDGAAETAEDTGVNLNAGGKIEVEIRGTGSAIEFYINGSFVGDLGAGENIPTTHLSNYSYALQLKNTAAANRKLRVNYVHHTD